MRLMSVRPVHDCPCRPVCQLMGVGSGVQSLVDRGLCVTAGHLLGCFNVEGMDGGTVAWLWGSGPDYFITLHRHL